MCAILSSGWETKSIDQKTNVQQCGKGRSVTLAISDRSDMAISDISDMARISDITMIY